MCVKIEPEQGTGQQREVQQTLGHLVKSAADWQAGGIQRQGSNTGACLRSNFLLMADIVMKQDAHLLVQEEKDLLECFKVCCMSKLLCQLQACAVPCCLHRIVPQSVHHFGKVVEGLAC